MTRTVFIADRVKKVDSVGQNVLIRGSMPLAGDPWHFAYSEISKASGVALPNYDLVDVSLVDCVAERHMLAPEMAAFELSAPGSDYWPPYGRDSYRPWVPNPGVVNTQNGQEMATFYWWPIEGLPEGGNAATFLGTPGWDFSGLADLLTALMQDQSGRPKAVYFHCSLGADRTGALHTGYLVRNGMALDDAVAKADSSTPAGAPNGDYERLRAAYARSRGA